MKYFIFIFFTLNINSLSASDKPNIVFILVDDLGWSAINGKNKKYQTPNIDKLKAEGVCFSSAYAPAPICSASRASILTGKSPARLNFEFVTKSPGQTESPVNGLPLKSPDYTLNLSLQEQTIPEVIKRAGYQTAFFGKWHVSAHHKRYNGWSKTHGPDKQGFDTAIEDFGGHSYNKSLKHKVESFTEGQYPADSMTDKAIKYLMENDKNDKPFFLMISHFYVHDPVTNQVEWVTDKYRKVLGNGVPEIHYKFGQFIEILDHHIGRVLHAIENAGIEDNTFVVVMSDNGGDPRYAKNSPLRGHKWTLYEGGVRVPLIMKWPGKINSGIVCDSNVIGSDLIFTFAEAAGIQLSSTDRDGVSLLGNLFSGSTLPERDLYWHFPYYHPEKNYSERKRTVGVDDEDVPFVGPHSAILSGKYKLIYFYESMSLELYKIEGEGSEKNNLAAELPDVTARLKAKLFDYLTKVKARFPEKNLNFIEK